MTHKTKTGEENQKIDFCALPPSSTPLPSTISLASDPTREGARQRRWGGGRNKSTHKYGPEQYRPCLFVCLSGLPFKKKVGALTDAATVVVWWQPSMAALPSALRLQGWRLSTTRAACRDGTVSIKGLRDVISHFAFHSRILRMNRGNSLCASSNAAFIHDIRSAKDTERKRWQPKKNFV